MEVILSIILVICFFILYRNSFVYRTRIKLLDLDMDYYDSLPSYDVMVFQQPFKWNYTEDFKKDRTFKIGDTVYFRVTNSLVFENYSFRDFVNKNLKKAFAIESIEDNSVKLYKVDFWISKEFIAKEPFNGKK